MFCSFRARCWLSRCCSCSWSWCMSACCPRLFTDALGTAAPSTSTLRLTCPRITGEPDNCGSECIASDPLSANSQTVHLILSHVTTNNSCTLWIMQLQCCQIPVFIQSFQCIQIYVNLHQVYHQFFGTSHFFHIVKRHANSATEWY